VDVGLTAIAVFVAVNPLLYVKPAERIVGLIQHRQDEMEFQRSVFASQSVPEDVRTRVMHVAWRAFDSYATPRGPIPISVDVVLVAAGLGTLAWRSVRDLRRLRAGPSLLFLCWLVATYAVVTPNLGFDSSHYFVPLVTLNVLTSGVAIAAAVTLARRLSARMRPASSSDRDQKVQAPTR